MAESQTTHNRTAAPSRRAWPPRQDDINEAVERAATALALRLANEDNWQHGSVLWAKPTPVEKLERPANSREPELVIGSILAVTEHTNWQVIWNPETKKGRVKTLGVQTGAGDLT